LSEELVWPPKKEDLLRLYVDQKLSAAKIANAYGLKNANPKSAETLVLYYLRKYGIKRRGRAEHIRKVTEKMVDEWVARYQAGESLRQIANGELTGVTVWSHLRKRGVTLRDKVEAQIKTVTKHERKPFAGDRLEKFYLLGFVMGDCSSEKHGRGVRVRTGTTHPALVELFVSLFGSYGHVRKYAKTTKLAAAELNLEVDLDGSFEFLLLKNIDWLRVLPSDSAESLSFFAGFFDAEGSIYFHRKRYSPGFELSITNKNEDLLRKLQKRLKLLDYHPKLYYTVQRPARLSTHPEGEIWKLSFHRRQEVRRLLIELPLRHREKRTKAKLAVSFISSNSILGADGVPEGWTEYASSIDKESSAFVDELVTNLGLDVSNLAIK
jgi:hypothetical protein